MIKRNHKEKRSCENSLNNKKPKMIWKEEKGMDGNEVITIHLLEVRFPELREDLSLEIERAD